MLISYLICGIPFGLIIASALEGVDVRQQGSGNIGMTNVARSAGAKAAALTFACDVGKGTVSMLLARYAIITLAFNGDFATAPPSGSCTSVLGWVFASCVLGHIFSPYLRFHGGKGISVGLGAALGFWWPMGLGLLAVFLIVTIPTHYISAGSICAAASLPIQSLIWHMPLATLLPVTLVAVIVIWSHRENIARLKAGKERSFTIHKQADSPDGDGRG